MVRLRLRQGSLLALLVSAGVSVGTVVTVGGERDCTSSTGLQDDSVRGSFRALAVSTQMGCSGRTMRVFGWLIGVPNWGCYTGQQWGSRCYDSSDSGNASTFFGGLGHGTAQALSEHSYAEGGQTIDMPGRDILLDAGLPDLRLECEALGGSWDVDSGTCEINVEPQSPIVIATGQGNRYRLTSADKGVLFDIDGDGTVERVAWTEAGVDLAFLAIDRDGDGLINSGRELFGDSTLPGVSNGFAALARMAVESNGGIRRASVSSEDPIFTSLLLWVDRNHNGVSEVDELRPVGDLFSDIGLAYFDHHRKDGHGNIFRYQGWVHTRTKPGRNRATSPEEDLARRRPIYDVFLTVK